MTAKFVAAVLLSLVTSTAMAQEAKMRRSHVERTLRKIPARKC